MEEKHWTTKQAPRARFWATVKEYGYSPDLIHAIFGVESMKDYPGSLEDALAVLAQAQPERPPTHAEARASANTSLVDPSGARWQITIREGASGEMVLDLIKNATSLSEYLFKRGWGTNGHSTVVPHVPAPYQGIAPDVPVSKAPPAPEPPDWPEYNDGDAGLAPATMQVMSIDYLKVTAPSGKPVVEFWRDGRKYAEAKWHLGGESLLEIAPSLATVGITAAHLDSVGGEYRVPLKVAWTPSPKNEKWKDVQAVKVVGA